MGLLLRFVVAVAINAAALWVSDALWDGVMINGGTLQAENVAVGAKSRAQSAPKAA